MAGIAGIGTTNSNLLQLLSQADSGLTDPTLLTSFLANETQAATGDETTAGATSADAGSANSLQEQIRSAVATALHGAEQSGGTDLKDVVYNTLVAVLKKNGIDPKTFKSTTGQSADGGAGATQGSGLDTATRNVLNQVMAALTDAMSSSDPVSQLLSQDASQTTGGLAALLPTSSTSSQGSTSVLSSFLGTQNSSTDLLGFLFDSNQ